jgi:hypothetical protein
MTFERDLLRTPGMKIHKKGGYKATVAANES